MPYDVRYMQSFDILIYEYKLLFFFLFSFLRIFSFFLRGLLLFFLFFWGLFSCFFFLLFFLVVSSFAFFLFLYHLNIANNTNVKQSFNNYFSRVVIYIYAFYILFEPYIYIILSPHLYLHLILIVVVIYEYIKICNTRKMKVALNQRLPENIYRLSLKIQPARKTQ